MQLTQASVQKTKAGNDLQNSLPEHMPSDPVTFDYPKTFTRALKTNLSALLGVGNQCFFFFLIWNGECKCKKTGAQAWSFMTIILALRQRQRDPREFEVNLGYRVSSKPARAQRKTRAVNRERRAERHKDAVLPESFHMVTPGETPKGFQNIIWKIANLEASTLGRGIADTIAFMTGDFSPLHIQSKTEESTHLQHSQGCHFASSTTQRVISITIFCKLWGRSSSKNAQVSQGESMSLIWEPWEQIRQVREQYETSVGTACSPKYESSDKQKVMPIIKPSMP